MKNRIFALLAVLFALTMTGCGTVPVFPNSVAPGHVGILVNKYGASKGVDTNQVLGVGRYWLTANQDIYEFPIFTQTKNWTASASEDSKVDESFDFQSAEGTTLNTDVGLQYTIDPTKVALLFQKYRNGIDEINNRLLRNLVRDAVHRYGAHDSLAVLIGSGKVQMFDSVQAYVSREVNPIGIGQIKVSIISDIRPKDKVVADAIVAKVAATQKTRQAEQELQTSKAEAAKMIADAQGEAEANRLKQSTITPQLIQMKLADRWDGHLPTVSGGTGGMILDLHGLTGK